MADFAAFLFEDGDDVLQDVQAVDGAGGVVRGVDDDGPGLFGNSCLKGVHIGFPRVLFCIDTGEVAAVVGDVEIVFDEVGGEGDQFLAGIEYGPEDGVEGAGRPDADDEAVAINLHALFL